MIPLDDTPPTICSRCVSDTTIPEIRFDDQGECQYCKMHREMEKKYPLDESGKEKLARQVEEIKKNGRGRQYDCIVGVSGGRDSTYLLHTAVSLGLRPLAVHFDNGWNSEIAVSNIRNATNKLGIDLYTHVADWEEFKNLQISFLKASVSDAEVPTDVAIFGTVNRIAAQEKIKYTLNGHSFRTEGIMPIGWTYMDGRYINSIHRRFGSKKLTTVPNFTLWDYFKYVILHGIKVVPLLNYFEYNQKKIDAMLTSELDWVYYGGHHHESYYTYFFQSYLLPQKFGIDKRKTEYSALIRSGQMTRAEAIKDITENPYPYDEEVVDYAVSKLGLSKDEFKEIMDLPVRSFLDYPTYYPLIRSLRIPITAAYRLGLISELIYLKYLG